MLESIPFKPTLRTGTLLAVLLLSISCVGETTDEVARKPDATVTSDEQPTATDTHSFNPDSPIADVASSEAERTGDAARAPDGPTLSSDTVAPPKNTDGGDTDKEDTTAPSEACTQTGFEVVQLTANTSTAAEGGFLELVAANATTAPADLFGVELLLDQRTTGPFAFQDINYATCERCIRIESGCVNGEGCQKTFLVYAGQMDITLWEDAGGAFEATFADLKAREVTISTELPLTSTAVPDGETWCVPSLTVSASPLGVF